MATSKQKPKAETAAKKAASAEKSTTTDRKTADASKTTDAKTTDAKTTDASKTESADTGGAPKNYSRGEGQKVVTEAYRNNWNAIFGDKKNGKKKKR